ncbi:hypothetical protein SAICODRAFT_28714 [Saitoella complicata NRRL Y-17804]|uniref:uncharacterized protein n=1 Tax=Saitoella complicata (strain BCRC 22490 / CBS 7301 / JCM 7358 / NBRC 10748 / NRRL Y-17804) TaxID=698492 RepID=UPI000866D919|nr:uncharacterized protein SAICODRAFT_28714 [Saitoella complicata NRRL Y-17804]ODQ55592.1 hypothetical protein SAICODRAFT_28714 [Saitoella complicata NRRL Y-17804]
MQARLFEKAPEDPAQYHHQCSTEAFPQRSPNCSITSIYCTTDIPKDIPSSNDPSLYAADHAPLDA